MDSVLRDFGLRVLKWAKKMMGFPVGHCQKHRGKPLFFAISVLNGNSRNLYSFLSKQGQINNG